MGIVDTHAHILTDLDVDITVHELLQQVKPPGRRPDLAKAAEKALRAVGHSWTPAAVYRWLEFEPADTGTAGYVTANNGNKLPLDFGYAIRFVEPAEHVLAAVFTAGPDLEQASTRASSRGDFIEAYLIDLTGLAVLEKTEQIIINLAEKKAVERGWGVGPFLSPGSVHGWELEEQANLCALLPLSEIGVSIQKSGVLKPFKAVSCLIGIGPGYDTMKVGNPCQVCSKRNDCEMQSDFGDE